MRQEEAAAKQKAEAETEGLEAPSKVKALDLRHGLGFSRFHR